MEVAVARRIARRRTGMVRLGGRAVAGSNPVFPDSEGLQIAFPGGLLSQLAGRVIETALGAELTEHLGYPPGQAPPGGAGNHRNGSTS
jgi:hypothetical protein